MTFYLFFSELYSFLMYYNRRLCVYCYNANDVTFEIMNKLSDKFSKKEYILGILGYFYEDDEYDESEYESK